MTHVMPSHDRTSRLHQRLMTSAAIAASLTALALSPPALAQGVAGSGVVNSGTASITAPNASTTRVTTTSQQTIVTWRPTDNAVTGGPINFLPSTNTLEFIGTANGYTVLNRFLGLDGGGNPIPINRQIALNGTINSVQNVAGSNIPGGNIWFYNAGGILIGSSGVINVGSLVLTSNDIDSTGGLFDIGGNIRFRGTSGSTSAVQINAGAVITVANTNPGGAYTAFVAPRVVQRGSVSTDGSTAYVAAEQADIRINQGLFDINVLVGAEGGTVIDHSGDTTGPAARDGDPNDSRIYMVAIPKNDAVTMLVAGQIGYQDPVSAQVDPNGAIRLSAGYDIFAGEIAQGRNPVSGADANIIVQDSIFSSDIIARAATDLSSAPVNMIPVSAGSSPQEGLIRFNGTALLQGDESASLSIGNQQRIEAARGLLLRSGGVGVQPGLAQISLTYNSAAPGQRPTMAVAGQLLVDASRRAFDSSGQATGGTARINNSGGLIVASDIILNAGGSGAFAGSSTAGGGRGGTAELIIAASAQVQAVSLTVGAAGNGGGDRFNPNLGVTEVAAVGGAGNGGTATVAVSGASALTVLQAFSINAAGSGGTGSSTAGTGTGGTARLSISGATTLVTTPGIQIDASGTGGSPVSTGPSTQSSVSRGGDASGGIAEIASGGIANLGIVSLDAAARSGNANSGINTGGNAFGGSANVIVTGGAMTLNLLNLDASGISGGGVGGLAAADIGGIGDGGNITVRASNGTITISGNVTADAQANTLAGSSDITLQRRGGDILFRAENAGTISAAGSLSADASGGFDSSTGSSTGTSFDASGGTITLQGDNGTLSFGSLSLSANGLTADGSSFNGDASGGGIELISSNNGVVETTGASANNSISVLGFAGSGPVGGQGSGGTVNLIAQDGRTTLTGFTLIDASGTSGTSETATAANPGQGGNILIRADSGFSGISALQLGDMIAQATGQSGRLIEGGTQPGGAVAGSGIGGTILFDAFGGTISGGDVAISADGIGGSSDDVGGGTGTGGSATITLGGGDMTLNTLAVTANGSGGRGNESSVSGNGVGGIVIVNINDGSMTMGTLTAEARGSGGDGSFGRDATASGLGVLDGGDAGDGQGGDVVVTVSGGSTNIGTLTLDAGGTGGNGGEYDGFNAIFGDTGNGAAAAAATQASTIPKATWQPTHCGLAPLVQGEKRATCCCSLQTPAPAGRGAVQVAVAPAARQR